MSRAIRRIKHYAKIFDLHDKQSLYLIYTYYKVSYPITSVHLKELIEYKVLDIKGNFTENLSRLKEDSVKTNVLSIDAPLFSKGMSEDIYKHLLKKIVYKDPVTGRPLSLNLDHFKPSARNTLGKEYLTRVDKLMGGNSKYANAYTVMLSLFPSATVEHNNRWVAFFKAQYTGVNLRIKSSGTAKRFKAVLSSNEYDAGIFIYAAFLAVSNGVTTSGTYVISTTRFYDEVDEWYMQALAKVATAKTAEELFRKGTAKNFKGGMSI